MFSQDNNHFSLLQTIRIHTLALFNPEKQPWWTHSSSNPTLVIYFSKPWEQFYANFMQSAPYQHYWRPSAPRREKTTNAQPRQQLHWSSDSETFPTQSNPSTSYWFGSFRVQQSSPNISTGSESIFANFPPDIISFELDLQLVPVPACVASSSPRE